MFKKFGRGFASGLLVLSLYLLATLTMVVVIFGTPQRIKAALVKSNVYNTFVDDALKQAKDSQNNQSNQNGPNNQGGSSTSISLTDPIVSSAAKKAVTPQLLQTSAENALDGVYGWLHQKTPHPQFVIDLTQAKQTFATSVGSSLAAHVQSLPVCTTAQLQSLDVNNVDWFTIPCRPPGIDIAAEQQKVVNDIMTNNDFLNKPVITGDDIAKNNGGQTYNQQTTDIPQAFHLLLLAPWIWGTIGLICVLIIVLLFDDKRQALKRLWISFLTVGLVLLLSFWLTNQGLRHITTTGTISSSKGLQHSGLLVAKSLASDANQVTGRFIILYLAIALALGLAWWLWGRKTKPGKHTSPPAAVTHTPEDSRSNEATSTKVKSDDTTQT